MEKTVGRQKLEFISIKRQNLDFTEAESGLINVLELNILLKATIIND